MGPLCKEDRKLGTPANSSTCMCAEVTGQSMLCGRFRALERIGSGEKSPDP